MKAKLNEQRSNGKNQGNNKELVSAYSVISLKTGRELVVCRCYMGRSSSASTVYASIWIHGDSYYSAGHGSAGGYGYHKSSAAIADAIKSAGIELFGDQYADEKGMVYKDFPNPEWSQEKHDAAVNAGDKNYLWANPKEIRKLVKENTKKKAYISGVGDDAVRCALLAIAKACLGESRSKFAFVSH